MCHSGALWARVWGAVCRVAPGFCPVQHPGLRGHVPDRHTAAPRPWLARLLLCSQNACLRASWDARPCPWEQGWGAGGEMRCFPLQPQPSAHLWLPCGWGKARRCLPPAPPLLPAKGSLCGTQAFHPGQLARPCPGCPGPPCACALLLGLRCVCQRFPTGAQSLCSGRAPSLCPRLCTCCPCAACLLLAASSVNRGCHFGCSPASQSSLGSAGFL